MKAERRHELQENSLARFMNNLPVMLRLYADRILLGVVLVLLVIVLINWRMNSTRQRVDSAGDSLAAARMYIRQLTMNGALGNAEQVGQLRSQAEREIGNAVDNAAENDNRLRAQAVLARGDLFWALANIPAATAAPTTQTFGSPSLARPNLTTTAPSATTGPTTSDADAAPGGAAAEFLTQAEQAYNEVLKSYADQTDAKIAALFGMGAVDENRRNFEAAKQSYEQVLAIKDAPKSFQSLATERISQLDQIRQPLLIGELRKKPEALKPMVFAPTTASASTTGRAPSMPPGSPTPTTAPATQPALRLGQ